MADQSQTDNFVRQRRNLLAISVVMLFVTFTGTQITKLVIFDTPVNFRYPEVVAISLWIAFVYWFWRFYVCRRHISRQSTFINYSAVQFQKSFALAQQQLDIAINKSNDANVVRKQATNISWAMYPPANYWPFFKRHVKCDYNDGTPGVRTHSMILEGNFKRDFLWWWDTMYGIIFVYPDFSEYEFPAVFAWGTLIACSIHRVVIYWP